MSAESLIRRVQSIHLGDGKYLDARAIEMQWFEADEEDDILSDDEMETLATVSFEVSSEEYILLARLGMVDTVPGGGEDDEDRSARVTFRTDRDLLDEAEETLREEWEQSLEDDSEEPTIWNDLDYWEVQSID
tara:strand:- start:305 stop:703 length:399 start_codon:yes stop_codon:yes gene_type:complete